MPSEAELRLRERLSRLRSLRLPGGVRVSREVERLEEQLERLSEQPPSDDQIWRLVAYVRTLSKGHQVTTENFTGKTLERGGR